MTEAYNTWRGHVIVCGLHGVGLRIVEELSLSGVPAVVVDDRPDPGLAGIMAGWGVPRLDASPRSADALTAAGLAGAAAVISTQDNDLRTLETALLVRKLRTDVRIVVELANPAVGRALTQIAVAVLEGLARDGNIEQSVAVEAAGRYRIDDVLAAPFLAVRQESARRGSTVTFRVKLLDWVRPFGKVDVCVTLSPRVGGKVCLYVSQGTELVADLNGYYTLAA